MSTINKITPGTPPVRHLALVLAEIIAIAPDTKSSLEPIRLSAMYSAPENMDLWWHNAAAVLNNEFSEHPLCERIAAIFSG